MSDMDIDDGPLIDSSKFSTREERETRLDKNYPDRPHNRAETLPFCSLFEELFNPLSANQRRKEGPKQNRRKVGPQSGKGGESPQEIRRQIVERYISRWRLEVGDDILPVFRLILPDKDRERPMYGLKEKILAKNLVKIMKIDKNSDDGFVLLNWKLPGRDSAIRMAGDFAGRCYEVIQKRPFRVDVGTMTIAEVNDGLDQLAAASKEEEQLSILEDFYRRMNPEELMWLIRIILRQMKIGATEKTIFNIWHPDADNLFNISSSLRRVCWELYNPSVRLEPEERGVTPMQCFQPQLAQFQKYGFEILVQKMRITEDDPTFWIEEKLDGERMQLHMVADEDKAGGRKFGFWSRKGKEYTYLYGNSLHDPNGSLTRYLGKAFQDGVENIILDGEMISWDPEQDAAIPFGHLKSAALAENKNPYAGKARPLFRVFDILYLNNRPLTRWSLRDRRNALERSMNTIHRRFELHEYTVATSVDDIEPMLRDVISRGDEGLVLKSPRSDYRLNERNDDWLKVKPEYMDEFGESLDCLIIGGYYGSGHRGGRLSSFLCGLKVDESHAKKGEYNSQKFWSFFKVGGGMTANDYANIRHGTENKWHKWDPKNPPTEYIELGGGELQIERPDVWIKPEDSLVIEAKAASVSISDQFRCGLTLRFPRFKRLRGDRDWQSALSVSGFIEVKAKAEKEQKEKKLQIDENKRNKAKSRKTERKVYVAGYGTEDIKRAKYEGATSTVFEKATFYIMTECTKPEKKSKIELEQMVKANGGKIVQTATAAEKVICVAERRTVKVASFEKTGNVNIVRPIWLFDCIKQCHRDFANGKPEMTVPEEVDRHFYFLASDRVQRFSDRVDNFGDSYSRDTDTEELNELMEKMGPVNKRSEEYLVAAIDKVLDLGEGLPGWIFLGTKIYFDQPARAPLNATSARDLLSTPSAVTAAFAGASITSSMTDNDMTHIVAHPNSDIKALRRSISIRSKLPRIVTPGWIEESWKERTRLDEDRFRP